MTGLNFENFFHLLFCNFVSAWIEFWYHSSQLTETLSKMYAIKEKFWNMVIYGVHGFSVLILSKYSNVQIEWHEPIEFPCRPRSRTVCMLRTFALLVVFILVICLLKKSNNSHSTYPSRYLLCEISAVVLQFSYATFFGIGICSICSFFLLKYGTSKCLLSKFMLFAYAVPDIRKYSIHNFQFSSIENSDST